MADIPQPKKPVEKGSAKWRRQAREKARREKMLRARPPGVKERFVSGCFAFGIVAIVVFIVALIYAFVTR
jgi:hypothetical protein